MKVHLTLLSSLPLSFCLVLVACTSANDSAGLPPEVPTSGMVTEIKPQPQTGSVINENQNRTALVPGARFISANANAICVSGDSFECWGNRPDYWQGFARRGELQISNSNTACSLYQGNISCYGDIHGANVHENINPVPATKFSVGSYQFLCWVSGPTAAFCRDFNRINSTKKSAIEAGIPSDLTDVTDIKVGGDFACLLDSGVVKCWGESDMSWLKIPSSLPKLTKIAAGDRHVCGLLETGSIECWGNNLDKQLEVPAGISGVTELISNPKMNTTCAVMSNTVKCWGGKYDLNPPPRIRMTSIQAFALGGSKDGGFVSAGFACALDGNWLQCWGDKVPPVPPKFIHPSKFVHLSKSNERCWRPAVPVSSQEYPQKLCVVGGVTTFVDSAEAVDFGYGSRFEGFYERALRIDDDPAKDVPLISYKYESPINEHYGSDYYYCYDKFSYREIKNGFLSERFLWNTSQMYVDIKERGTNICQECAKSSAASFQKCSFQIESTSHFLKVIKPDGTTAGLPIELVR